MGKSKHCVAHSGGRRCQTEGCERSAAGKTTQCIAHGGGYCCCVCSETSIRHHNGACFKCHSRTSLKRWKTFTTGWLYKLGWPWSYSDETLPCARSMSTRDKSCIKRPDYVFVFDTHAVILEGMATVSSARSVQGNAGDPVCPGHRSTSAPRVTAPGWPWRGTDTSL